MPKQHKTALLSFLLFVSFQGPAVAQPERWVSSIIRPLVGRPRKRAAHCIASSGCWPAKMQMWCLLWRSHS